MDKCFNLFTPEEFYERKPKLNDRQIQLRNAYYQARRDTANGERVKTRDILQALEAVQYETDLALSILQKVDDHYLKLCADELKRKQKNG